MRPLLFLCFAIACSQPSTTTVSEPAVQPATDTKGEVTIIGKLTSEGVECKALRADGSNELYTLAGNTGGFASGDHVKVVGKIVEVSYCMQGTTIAVKSITRV